MEIPDHIRKLVDELGEALVRALVNDPDSRELAQRIQDAGYDLSLSLEASISITRREEGDEDPLLPQWSEADIAELRTFRIKLD